MSFWFIGSLCCTYEHEHKPIIKEGSQDIMTYNDQLALQCKNLNTAQRITPGDRQDQTMSFHCEL